MFFLPLRLSRLSATHTSRLHNYSKQIRGEHYFFSRAQNEATEGDQFYMTAYGNGVKLGDRIQLKQGTELREYWVKAIDYYSDTPNLWTGLLVPVE